jgi:threonine dehydrogenase-like Zn-dependent dehydrogenase
MGNGNVEVRDVPEPQILNRRDAIVRITDRDLWIGPAPLQRLHAIHEKGDILGHEFMGEVMELGAGVKNLKVGTASWSCSRSPAATVGTACTTCGRCARTPTRTPPWQRS